MDTFTSGGMAPALQSTNHQSTDLVNSKADSNGVREILPTEKVNGNTCEATDSVPVLVATQPEDLKLVSYDYAAGDCKETGNPYIDQTMTVTESYMLSIPKGAQPPVTSAALHIGQGDCTASHTFAQNGWGSGKKPHTAGVLQESNNTLCNVCCVSKEHLNKPVRLERPLPSDSKVNCSKVPSVGSNENRLNGRLEAPINNRLSSAFSNKTSGVADALHSQINTTVTFSSTNGPKMSHTSDSNTTNIRTTYREDRSRPDDAKHSTSSIQFVPRNNATTTENPSNGDSFVRTGDYRLSPTVTTLPQALKNTDLLCGDLSKINVSHKLVHTLQELAASLKGATFQQLEALHQTKNPTPGFNHTVTHDDHEKLHRSVKSLDFYKLPAVRQSGTISKALFEAKLATAASNAKTLQKRLFLLNEKIDSLRLAGVKKHVGRDLCSVAVNNGKKTLSRDKSADGMAGAAWVSGQVNVTDPQDFDILHQKDGDYNTQKFWVRVLQKKNRESQARHFSAEENSDDRSLQGLCDFSKAQRNATDAQIKKVETDESSVLPAALGVNLDPIVQLTRVEHANKVEKRYSCVLEKAKTNSGIICKELRYLHSRYDPDVTDSSSDEEVIDVTKKHTKHPVIRDQHPKPVLKKAHATNKRYRNSFCKWVAERAEISKRWTWLQSRISNLEFTIRQQGDLYRKLRNAKGPVQLGMASNVCDIDLKKVSEAKSRILQNQQTPPTCSLSYSQRQQSQCDLPVSMTVSTSPCNVNQLLNNVHHQTAKLFDNLSPLSGGSPSPNQPVLPVSPTTPAVIGVEMMGQRVARTSNRYEEKFMTSARTKPIRSSTFKHRKLVKLLPLNQLSNKVLKPKTVPNDSCIMRIEGAPCKYHLNTTESHALKAAVHDHSYHAIISSINDVPLSLTMQAIMKSKRKWCKTPGSSGHASLQTTNKDVDALHKHKRQKKPKHKSHKKKSGRSHTPMLPPNPSLDEMNEAKRRRLYSQVFQSESGRKRHRVTSFDSDMESSVVIGGISSHQFSRSTVSGTNTPTQELSGQQSQNYWKKKKSSEQAYDINNIIIPHGLNSARIEKLAYKEIQTPSWRIVEPKPESAFAPVQETGDSENEDTSYIAYQKRHDRYEIMEKKKYMAYMEWSISRKGRCSRMSNVTGAITPEAMSPPPNVTVPCNGEPALNSTVSNLSDPTAMTSADPTGPTAKPAGVRTRQMSTEQNPGRSTTPLPQLQVQHSDADTSISHSYSSPSLAYWQEGLGSRRISNEKVAAVNRTMSDGGSAPKYHEHRRGTWEIRTFPLLDDDVKVLEDVNYALQKLQEDSFGRENYNDEHNPESEEEDGKSSKRLQPVSHQWNSEGYRSSHSTPLSIEALQDHQQMQHSKPISSKRRRTDSRASSLASHDDPGRHSDASNASASSSAYRKRKKGASGRNFSTSQQRRDLFSGQKYSKEAEDTSRLARIKHKYLQIRLSETEDSSSDTDSDNSHTSDDTSTSYDDAGHRVDDFADPEWDFHSSRQRS